MDDIEEGTQITAKWLVKRATDSIIASDADGDVVDANQIWSIE